MSSEQEPVPDLNSNTSDRQSQLSPFARRQEERRRQIIKLRLQAKEAALKARREQTADCLTTIRDSAESPEVDNASMKRKEEQRRHTAELQTSVCNRGNEVAVRSHRTDDADHKYVYRRPSTESRQPTRRDLRRWEMRVRSRDNLAQTGTGVASAEAKFLQRSHTSRIFDLAKDLGFDCLEDIDWQNVDLTTQEAENEPPGLGFEG